MKELAFRIDSVADFELIDNINQGNYKTVSEKLDILKKQLLHMLDKVGDLKISRVYFGSEFCQYKIPEITIIKNVLEECNKRSLSFTFVTPPVTDYGIQKLDKIFRELKDSCIEVEFNDYGTLQYLNDSDNNFHLVTGRIIDKTPHDNRLTKEQILDYYRENGLEYVRNISLFSEGFADLLDRYNVDRIDIDMPIQGIDFSDAGNRKIGVYFPFGYLTTGRMCQMKLNEQSADSKFDIETPCKGNLCDYCEIDMSKQLNNFPLSGENIIRRVHLYRKGNTIFYPYKKEQISDSDLENISRLIIQPRLMI